MCYFQKYLYEKLISNKIGILFPKRLLTVEEAIISYSYYSRLILDGPFRISALVCLAIWNKPCVSRNPSAGIKIYKARDLILKINLSIYTHLITDFNTKNLSSSVN